MALPLHALSKLKPLIKGRVLSLGYPDILATPEEIEQLFGVKPEKFNEEAGHWHGFDGKPAESFAFFESLGAKLDVVDFTQERGCEKIADLNYPQNFGEYDLVIDPGTLEHCFNIGQAFVNAVEAVKIGGYICHLSPMTMMNHGFYNLNPTLFHDFYIQNEWDLLELKVLPMRVPNVHSTARFTMQIDYIIRVLARRKHREKIKFPVQTKYLQKMAAKEAK